MLPVLNLEQDIADIAQIAALRCTAQPGEITLHIFHQRVAVPHTIQLSGVEGHILDTAAPLEIVVIPVCDMCHLMGTLCHLVGDRDILIELAPRVAHALKQCTLIELGGGGHLHALLIQDAAQAFLPAQDLECFQTLCGHGLHRLALEHLFKTAG